jgi:hypothetical protein
MADSLVSRFGCYTITWDVTVAPPGRKYARISASPH